MAHLKALMLVSHGPLTRRFNSASIVTPLFMSSTGVPSLSSIFSVCSPGHNASSTTLLSSCCGRKQTLGKQAKSLSSYFLSLYDFKAVGLASHAIMTISVPSRATFGCPRCQCLPTNPTVTRLNPYLSVLFRLDCAPSRLNGAGGRWMNSY